MTEQKGREGELIINRSGGRKQNGGSESGFLKKGPVKRNRDSSDLQELPPTAYYPWHALSPRKTETLDVGDITLEAANLQGRPQPFDWISVVFQPLGALLAIVLLLVILHLTGTGMSMGLYMLIGSVTGVLGILWGVIRYRSQKKEAARNATENVEKYRAYLRKMEDEISEIAEKQRRMLNADHPSVHDCSKLDEHAPQLWNCDIEDPAFLSLRLGKGSLPLCCRISPPTTRYSEENTLNDEACALAEKFAQVEDVPIVCDLRSTTTLGIVGAREAVTAEALALITYAAARYSYEDLKIALIYPESEKEIWGKARFLPHVFDDNRNFRFMADTAKEAKRLIQQLSDIREARKEERSSFGFGSGSLFRPHYLVFFIDPSLGYMLRTDDPELGVSCVYLASTVNRLPSHCEQIVELGGSRTKFYQKSSADVIRSFSPESLTTKEWEDFVQRIAAIRLETPKVKTGIPGSLGFLQLYGVSSPEQLKVEERWKKAKPDKSLNVMLGAGEGAAIEEFDIFPDKCGPNGLFVGTAGSGKTSMVRSWILSMAASYSPEDVNFVLIDFKDPGLINGLDKLPHVVGTIGKLDAEGGDIYRNLTALNSEMERRQRLFKKAESVSIYDYRRKRMVGNENAREALSFLFIVVDELNEFKSWNRDSAGADWMVALDSLYAKGRALGIQIISGSQTTGPFTTVMDGNANFRWCLRTQMKEESRALLGTADGYHIQNRGRAFMRVGGSITEIQPAFADGVYYSQAERELVPEREIALVSLNGERTRIKPPLEDRASELELTANYISETARRKNIRAPRKIWPDRLPERLTLEDLPEPEKENALCAVVGLLDDPVRQEQYPMQIDLPQQGSFLVFGAARLGKTSFLQSFACSLLSSNSPERLEVYIVESAVGDFAGFEAFPQVRKIVAADNAAETVKGVADTLAKRKSRPADEQDKQIVLIVDGLNALISDPDTKVRLLGIVQNGGGRGVYLVGSALNMIGAGSVSQLSDQTKFGLSFWVDHSSHSYHDLIHDRNVKAVPPADIPGRGVTSIGRVVSFQAALPCAGENRRNQSEWLREKAFALWGSSRPAAEETESANSIGIVRVGEHRDSKEPVCHDFSKNTSLLVLGEDPERRTAVLRNLARQLAEGVSAKAVLGVDLAKEEGKDIAGMIPLRSGKELDDYLMSMKGELSARGAVKLKEGEFYPPYCFIIPDFAQCLRNSNASLKRIDNNLILGGRSFSVFTLIGCSYRDFESMMAEENRQIRESAGARIPVPIMRLVRGRCLLLDADTGELNEFFAGKYSFRGNGTYYLTGEKAIPVDPASRR